MKRKDLELWAEAKVMEMVRPKSVGRKVITREQRLLATCKELLEICRYKCAPDDEVCLANGKTNHQALVDACEVIGD